MIGESTERFDAWAIVEAMGFKKLAGHVTEQTIGGSSLLRVDVPETVDANGEHPTPAYCKLIGVGSIYMITPCDEATARAENRRLREIENSRHRRKVKSRPNLCNYCKQPFAFDELMTRIEHGPGKPCELVHAKCAASPTGEPNDER